MISDLGGGLKAFKILIFLSFPANKGIKESSREEEEGLEKKQWMSWRVIKGVGLETTKGFEETPVWEKGLEK